MTLLFVDRLGHGPWDIVTLNIRDSETLLILNRLTLLGDIFSSIALLLVLRTALPLVDSLLNWSLNFVTFSFRNISTNLVGNLLAVPPRDILNVKMNFYRRAPDKCY